MNKFEVIDVHKIFDQGHSLLGELAAFFKRPALSITRGTQALRGVSLELKKGEILGLVGESGSGKSTLGRLLAGLYQPSSGKILYEGRNINNFSRREMLRFRRQVQIMFQDPVSSLNPRQVLGDILTEPFVIHHLYTKQERREKILKLLDEVGLPDELGRYPHEFSGGQRQRLSLARALCLDPEVLIADEPVSALDVSIQAQIVNLLLDLQEKRSLSLILISHDLPLVKMCADRLVVLYGGLVMEMAAKEHLGQIEHHPYLKSLWASASGDRQYILDGEPPDPKNPPPACPFQPRCPEARTICRQQRPALLAKGPGLAQACHFR